MVLVCASNKAACTSALEHSGSRPRLTKVARPRPSARRAQLPAPRALQSVQICAALRWSIEAAKEHSFSCQKSPDHQALRGEGPHRTSTVHQQQRSLTLPSSRYPALHKTSHAVVGGQRCRRSVSVACGMQGTGMQRPGRSLLRGLNGHSHVRPQPRRCPAQCVANVPSRRRRCSLPAHFCCLVVGV